jgi:uncharacterized DUF497 family protein
MKIVWDEKKRLDNIRDHEGYDFASLGNADGFTAEGEAFFTTATIVVAKKGRRMAIGPLEGHTIAVVYARLGSEAISLVSMRRADRAERRLHHG